MNEKVDSPSRSVSARVAYTQEYIQRMAENAKNDKYLEAFLIMCGLVEEGLKKLITRKIEYLTMISSSTEIDYDFSEPKIKNETLGKLISYLKRFRINPTLIKELEKFNEKRIRCIHKMIQVAPKTLNEYLRESFVNDSRLFVDILDRIIDIQGNLLKKLQSRKKVTDSDIAKIRSKKHKISKIAY